MWRPGGSGRKHKGAGKPNLKRRSKESLSKPEAPRECRQQRLHKALQTSGNPHGQQLAGWEAQASGAAPTSTQGLTGCLAGPSLPIPLQAAAQGTSIVTHDGASGEDQDVAAMQPNAGHQGVILQKLCLIQPALGPGIGHEQKQQAVHAVLQQQADAPVLLEARQQGPAGQLSPANNSLYNRLQPMPRLDDLQHVFGKELRQALHLELSHAAQADAPCTNPCVLRASNGLATNAHAGSSVPASNLGVPFASISPAVNADRQPGGACMGSLAAQDSHHPLIRPNHAGTSAPEGALENEVDRRRSEAGIDPKSRPGESSCRLLLMRYAESQA